MEEFKSMFLFISLSKIEHEILLDSSTKPAFFNLRARPTISMIITLHSVMRRAVVTGGWGEHAPPPPTDHLTLSQPGRQIMPTILLIPPRIFRPSYGPAAVLNAS